MCMTLGCDFRIAAENAKIGFTFVKLGIHPGNFDLFRKVFTFPQAWVLLSYCLD